MFEDEAFSKTRLKSCFLFSFSSWVSLVHDVEHSFVRDFCVFPSFVLVVGLFFALVPFFLWFGSWPLSVYVLYTP